MLLGQQPKRQRFPGTEMAGNAISFKA